MAGTFNDAARRAFALLFGCDGDRPKTRKPRLGGRERSSHSMGGHLFLKVVPHTGLLSTNISELFGTPGRMVTRFLARCLAGGSTAAFFRTPRWAGWAAAGWPGQDSLRADPNERFDSVCRHKLGA